MTDARWSRRDFFKRTGVTALAAAGVPALIAGCSKTGGEAKALDEYREQGFVRVGFAGEVPYGFTEGGKITGESPEVARAVLKELGINDVKGEEVKWEALIPSLKKGDFDIIAAGMFITKERCQEVLFSDPDYVAPNAFLVPKGNPKNLTDFESIAKSGATVGGLNGAVEIDFAKKAGVSDDKVKALKDPATAYNELEAKKIDAIALTRISLQTQLDQHEGAPFEITEPFFPVVDGKEQKNGGGFAFRKDSKELRDAFNEKLRELKEGKKIFGIIKPFGFVEKEAVDAIGVSATDLGCKE